MSISYQPYNPLLIPSKNKSPLAFIAMINPRFIINFIIGIVILFSTLGCDSKSAETQAKNQNQSSAVSKAEVETVQPKNPQVIFKTSHGEILIELYPEKAPNSVENFIQYVDEGFYNETLFHRVIPGFVIQGGGMDKALKRKPTNQPIINEANNGLKNLVSTLSMARTGDPHSATSQFFINLSNNKALDHRDESQRGWGYAVFGKVVRGMEVVRSIENVPTEIRAPFRDVPETDILVLEANVVQ